MAKVQGPLFSLKGVGTLAKTLTYQSRSGSTAVFVPKAPYDPQSVSQLSVREYVSRGIYYWHTMPPAYTTDWNNFVD